MRVSSPPVGTFSSASDVTDHRIETASVDAVFSTETVRAHAADDRCCSLSVLVLGVKAMIRRGVGTVGGAGRVRADAQPYLGLRSVAADRRRDG
jgi:hypothetical protein